MGWVWSQVQLLPVGQVVESRGTEANVVECFHKSSSVYLLAIKHLGQCPGLVVLLVLDPLWGKLGRWCVPVGPLRIVREGD